MSKRKITLYSLLLLFVIGFFAVTLSFYSYTPPKADAPSPIWETATPERASDQYYFLCLGRDRASLCTDVILLCTLNVKNHSLFCLQLPRDTYFSHEGTTRLNALFAQYVLQGQDEKTALRSTADAIGQALSLPIDYTALLYLDDFVQIVDAIGGVPLTVPFDMDYDDPTQGLSIHLDAGEQVLSGAQAEQFVRFRKTDVQGNFSYSMGDLGRIQAQKLFLSALFDRLQSFSLTDAMATLPIAFSAIVTDCNLRSAFYFAKQAKELSQENVTFQTLPGRITGNAYTLSRSDTYRLLCERFYPKHAAPQDAKFDAALQFCQITNTDAATAYYGCAQDDTSYTAQQLQELGMSDRDLYLKKRP